MTRLAAAIVRFWVRIYTSGLETTTRERIRQEVESDLWEQMNTKDATSNPTKVAMIILLRWMLGIPADVQRVIEETDSRGPSVWTKEFFGVVAQRRSWFNLLIVSGVSFSLLFIGFGTFIAGIFLIVIPVVLLASPIIVFWPDAPFGSISPINILQALLQFLVGMAMLLVMLHLSKLVSLSLQLGGQNKAKQNKHTGLVYQVFGVLYDHKAWISLLFIISVMLSLVFLGTGTFIAALVLAIMVGSLIANPFIYPQHTFKVVGPLIVDTPIESALAVVAGLGLALIVFHLSNLAVGTIGKAIISRLRPSAV